MLTPNDIRKGDTIATRDGEVLTVVDNGRGIRRRVTIDGDTGSTYVFDWYRRFNPDGTTDGIEIPSTYLKKAETIAKDGVRVSVPKKKQPLATFRSWGGQRPTDSDDAITDGNTMFATSALTPSTLKRLSRVNRDYKRLVERTKHGAENYPPLSVESVHRVWTDAVVNARRPATIAETSDISTTDATGQTVDDVPVSRLLLDNGESVRVDARKLALAQKLTKSTEIRARDGRHPIVGYIDDVPVFILMPRARVS